MKKSIYLRSRLDKHGWLNRFLYLLALLFSSACVMAASVGLPDSERPGQVRPATDISETDIPETLPAEITLDSSIAQDTVVDIPAVIDRPFDIEEGPFIVVAQFRLLDAEDLPQFEINIADIQTTVLEKNRAAQPARGFSIGQLQNVANEVTQYYRNKGLIVTTAVLPVQTVADGTVDIQIFLGRLGRVLVESNEHYSESVLRTPFEDLIGQPITQQNIEAALLRLTDYPGLSVFGVFQPGQKVGEADIVLKVQEEKHYDVAYHIDNQGLPTTGRNRFRTTIDWNAPTGLLADRVVVNYQQTYNPKNSRFWSIDYDVAVGDGYLLGIGVFKNEFDVGGRFSANDISSATQTYNIWMEKSFIRSRQENLSSSLRFAHKVSATQAGIIRTSTDRLATLSLAIDYDSVDTFHPFRGLMRMFDDDLSADFGGGLNFATLAYTRGFNDVFGALGSDATQVAQREAGGLGKQSSRRGASNSKQAPGEFVKVFGRYQRLQLMGDNQSLLFRAEMQWSDDLLLPLEQYSVGGPDNVRGYPDSQGLFDRAFFLSFEYIFNAPFFADKPAFDNRTWGEVLQFSVFYDFATAKQNDGNEALVDLNGGGDTRSGHWITYRSLGMGLRFDLPGSISSRLMYARGLGDEIPSNNQFGQIWGDFTYNF